METDRKRLSVQQALEWAFGREFAQLTFAGERDYEARAYGMEYVILQRAILGGVRVDISRGRSYPHHDADVIAATVSGLSEESGGRRMAYWIAELARAGATPDWLPDVEPRLQPVEWARRNQNGQYGKSERLGYHVETIRVPHPKNPRRWVERQVRREILYTPCTWDPCTPDDLKRARNWYVKWWLALDEIRVRLEGLSFRDFDLNRVMPPKRPWATRSTLAVRPGESPR